MAGEPWLLRAVQGLADHGVDAVGADDDVGGHGAAVGEPDLDTRAVVADPAAPAAGLDPVAAHRVGEHRHQVAAVRVQVGRTVGGGNARAERCPGEQPSVVPAAEVEGRRRERRFLDGLQHAEAVQDPREVGRELDPAPTCDTAPDCS